MLLVHAHPVLIVHVLWHVASKCTQVSSYHRRALPEYLCCTSRPVAPQFLCCHPVLLCGTAGRHTAVLHSLVLEHSIKVGPGVGVKLGQGLGSSVAFHSWR